MYLPVCLHWKHSHIFTLSLCCWHWASWRHKFTLFAQQLWAIVRNFIEWTRNQDLSHQVISIPSANFHNNVPIIPLIFIWWVGMSIVLCCCSCSVVVTAAFLCTTVVLSCYLLTVLPTFSDPDILPTGRQLTEWCDFFFSYFRWGNQGKSKQLLLFFLMLAGLWVWYPLNHFFFSSGCVFFSVSVIDQLSLCITKYSMCENVWYAIHCGIKNDC